MSDDRPFHNPFGVLRDLTGLGPADPRPTPTASDPAAPAEATSQARIPRAVVRMERSGRGGKTVTVVDQLPLTEEERDVWIKALKASLGCGGQVEGATLVLQGDQRKRLPALLKDRGVKQVTSAE